MLFLFLSAIFGGREPGAHDPDHYRRLIADNLGFIEERCRRAYGIASHWQAAEDVPAANRADALLVEVLDHLKADDFRVLREYRGRSSVRRYIEVVIANKVVDLYRSKEGRSRASEEARKMGDAGVRLYELAFVDGLPVEEAHRVMSDEGVFTGTLDELGDMAGRIRQRRRPSHTEVSLGAAPVEGGDEGPGAKAVKDDNGTLTVPDESLSPERILMQGQRIAARKEALAGIAALLTPEEALMARMRFNGGMKVKDIAAALGVTEKGAYRAFESMLARCRAMLTEKGLRPEDLL